MDDGCGDLSEDEGSREGEAVESKIHLPTDDFSLHHSTQSLNTQQHITHHSSPQPAPLTPVTQHVLTPTKGRSPRRVSLRSSSIAALRQRAQEHSAMLLQSMSPHEALSHAHAHAHALHQQQQHLQHQQQQQQQQEQESSQRQVPPLHALGAALPPRPIAPTTFTRLSSKQRPTRMESWPVTPCDSHRPAEDHPSPSSPPQPTTGSSPLARHPCRVTPAAASVTQPSPTQSFSS
ncbi:hypothetical protein O3P69_001329 [Scylla paramamosain]|uniref:OAR domain-containing protein n=1 Tax=Scylla paramamosain TaxID=85552 RepID=A0AAW0UR57_SCYPA